MSCQDKQLLSPTPLVWWAWIKPICLLEPSHNSFSSEITINQRLSEEVFSPSNFMSAGRSCQVIWGVLTLLRTKLLLLLWDFETEKHQIERKKRNPPCLSNRKHKWRHNRWGKGRKITLINKETGKRRERTVSRGTPSHENSLQQMLKSDFVLKTEKGLLSSHLIPNAAGSSGNVPPSLVVHWRNTCLQSLFRKGSKAISCLEQIPELGCLPSPRHSQPVASRLSSQWKVWRASMRKLCLCGDPFCRAGLECTQKTQLKHWRSLCWQSC